ncbi:MAG TPA: hypothetical protein VLQ20_06130 [Planococcus sp. (in: firmicutes)]|nr:hypothetical protein [Planococcus sp. (in: firmicutes)]
MPRKGLLVLFIASAISLAGCSATPEEKIADAFENAYKAFSAEPREANESSDGTAFYLPGGYTVEEPSNERSINITKGSDSFMLTANPNEAGDSTLFYDLLKSHPQQEWAAEETFEENGRFGFAAVRKIADDRFELVASAGSAKLVAVTEADKIEENLDWMMETVRSIDNEKGIN